ncbi:MAG: hypothetical protein DRQ47_08120, partial [Gammaproteobacteria bacterium]
MGVFSAFSFSQIASFWTIVAVTPQSTDDKDIALYSNCASGSILATSTGTSGTDFIVGDFNHNAAGTFYPETSYGSQTDPYTVEWVTGRDILPISVFDDTNLGYPSSACPIVRIWDVYLEQGVEYRIDFVAMDPPYGFLSLFRNPGTTEFWAGRYESEWEIGGDTAPFIYVPPATDWYGVVAFSDEPLPTWTPVGVRFEELNDCISLEPDACAITHLYSVASGPSTDYAITPITSTWMAMAVTCQYVDEKCLTLHTECDKGGTQLAQSNDYMNITEVIVGDFHHTSTATVYPAIGCSDVGEDYMFQWTEGPAELPLGAPGVFGTINTTPTDSDIIDVYDLALDAGVDYRLKFMESGNADIQVGLFANYAGAEYWQDRDNGMWELSDPTDSYVFTAPVTDIYGLVVFGDEIDRSSTYSL